MKINYTHISLNGRNPRGPEDDHVCLCTEPKRTDTSRAVGGMWQEVAVCSRHSAKLMKVSVVCVYCRNVTNDSFIFIHFSISVAYSTFLQPNVYNFACLLVLV